MALPVDTGERGKVLTDFDVLVQGYSTYLSGLHMQPKTILEYTKDVRRWGEWWKRPIEFFKQEEWDDWMAHLAETGVVGSTVNRYRCSVKRFYKYLRRRKLVTHDPSYDSEGIKRESRLPEIATQEEVKRMKARLKSPRTRALFALLYDCGLRNKEAREITIDRIGTESVHISGKRAKDRIIPITPETYATIKAWMDRRPEGSLWMFPTAGGNVMDEAAVYKTVGRVAKAVCPLKHLSPHSLRHSIATHLIERGMLLENLQSFLGHDNIETTRRYVRLAQKSLREAVLRSHPTLH